MSNQQNQNQGSSSQEYLDVKELKDGVVVLRDGSLRAVLSTSSVNFELKSDPEQEAIILGFQQFLNSLDFPLQILVSSRRFDVDPYLNTLLKQRNRERNELLRNQITDYVDFVKDLVGVANIMSKSFYVVVPFYLIESTKGGFVERLSASLNPKKAIFQRREEFETYKNQLFQRVGQIREGLSSIGIKVAPLNTQELVELYYNFYNPSEFEHVNIGDIYKIDIEN